MNRADYHHDLNPTEQLCKWIRAQPKPFGLMCCNDIRSRHALEACHLLNLRVPADVAIIGVDNDEVICQGMDPMLSSIDPNAYRVGYEAAEMVHALIRGKKTRDRVLVPLLGVVPRASTHTASADDPEVAAALQHIHDSADRPISVPDVAYRLGISRRTLERRFERTTGFSIATAIRRAHVERAKQLLIDTDLSLEEVSESSGLKSVRQLRITFMQDLGTSPGQFRSSFQSSR